MQTQVEFKSFGLKVDKFDEVKGIFTGYASAYNKIDRIKDTVIKGAYDDSIEEWKSGSSIPVNFDHDKTINLSPNLLEMKSDENGLLVSFQVSPEAKSLYPDIYQWAVSKAQSQNLFMSVGLYVLKSNLGGNRRILKEKFVEADTIYKAKLDHIAVTDNPIDPSARMLEVKSMRTPRYPIHLSDEWDAQAAEKRWRAYSKSLEMPSNEYKNGFMYVESGREDLFTAYHFLLVDIVDGEPVVNEQAVITSYRYLKGAVRGVKILNAEQKLAALGIISSLYKKINRLRKEEGMDLLPEIEIKSDINYNDLIDTIDGKVSAKRFLKNHQGNLSNTNIENFVDRISGLIEIEVKSQIELEAREKPQGQEQTSVRDGQTLHDLFNQAGKLLTKIQ
jgi:HK97 family phage prohead protease